MSRFYRTDGFSLRRRCLIGAALFWLSPLTVGAQPLEMLPPPGEPVSITLTTEETHAAGSVLTVGRDNAAQMQLSRGGPDQYWILSPAGRNLFRLQLFETGRLWSLAVDGPGAPNAAGARVALTPSRQEATQLWRLNPSLAVADAVRLESVAFPGRYLAGSRNSVVSLQPASASAAQNWFLDATPPPPNVELPTVRMTEHVIRPRAELRAAPTTFVNSHSSPLWVLVQNLSDGSARRLTIPAGGSVDVALDRDAGATILESYQVVTPLGTVYREQFATHVPASTLYDVTVYEQFLQSIAIDRTGKSPNKIEDINHQPKGVGIFAIPAGPAFQGGTIDVYELAKRANNPGAVPPLRRVEGRDGEEALGPLEQILLEAER